MTNVHRMLKWGDERNWGSKTRHVKTKSIQMKKLFYVIFLLPLISQMNAQVTSSAGFGEEIPSAACLACPGTDWNNLENITMADGYLATTGVSSNGFCFMSTCYYNRFVY